jgi:hypothetical protein
VKQQAISFYQIEFHVEIIGYLKLWNIFDMIVPLFCKHFAITLEIKKMNELSESLKSKILIIWLLVNMLQLIQKISEHCLTYKVQTKSSKRTHWQIEKKAWGQNTNKQWLHLLFVFNTESITQVYALKIYPNQYICIHKSTCIISITRNVEIVHEKYNTRLDVVNV